MTEALKDLLFRTRQHPAFQELLKEVPKPRRPRFKASGGETAEQFGAKTIHAAGQQDMHDQWIAFLTGDSPQGNE